MTVLRPSFPPVSSITTRMLSLPGAAACAVRATNCGTIDPSATSDEPRRARDRNARRVNMETSGIYGRLRQLVLRHRQERVDRLADVAGRSVLGHECCEPL